MPELDIKELLECLGSPESAVADAEAEYEKKIDEVAFRVVDSGSVRVIYLAGPSGSGKTTTANLLADRIRELGEKSLVVSMDNFYLNSSDPRYPRLNNGERDFESPYALDTETLRSTISKVISGAPFAVPKYDFKAGGLGGSVEYESFSDGCVIIEGIHALNPIFSDTYPKGSVLKMFVSVSTNINDGARRIISGKKLRFVRRMVRDNIYRGASAERTLAMWSGVLAGEEEHLYPYKSLADIRFDTFHSFEPSVLKPFADELLTEDIVNASPYARTVKSALAKIPALPSDIVPDSSLIREFIPGGIYEELY